MRVAQFCTLFSSSPVSRLSSLTLLHSRSRSYRTRFDSPEIEHQNPDMSKKTSVARKTTSQTTAAEQQLMDLKEELRTDGETVVLQTFPDEVARIDALLQSGRYNYDQIPVVAPAIQIPLPPPSALPGPPTVESSGSEHAKSCAARLRKSQGNDSSSDSSSSDSSRSDRETAAAARKPAFLAICAAVPCNAGLVERIDELKPILWDAVANFNRVGVWIQLLIPKMEDGNNFGVSIQEEVQSEVHNVEAASTVYTHQLHKYFQVRARMVTKIARYPHVADYRRSIQDIDEQQFINLRRMLIDLRNHYVTLHDLINKNLTKIRHPRNDNSGQGMY